MLGDVGMDLRLSDIVKLLQYNDVIDKKKVALKLNDRVIYVSLEDFDGKEKVVDGDKGRWLLVDSTEANILSKLQREIRRRKEVEASLAFLNKRQSARGQHGGHDVDTASLEMQLSGDVKFSSKQKLDEAQNEIRALKQANLRMREQLIFKHVARRIAEPEKESMEMLRMYSEDQNMALMRLNELLVGSKQAAWRLEESISTLREKQSSLIAERNNLAARCQSGAKDLAKAMKMAKESREEAQAFKGAVSRLVDVISVEEEEEEECDVEDEVETLGICR